MVADVVKVHLICCCCFQFYWPDTLRLLVVLVLWLRLAFWRRKIKI